MAKTKWLKIFVTISCLFLLCQQLAQALPTSNSPTPSEGIAWQPWSKETFLKAKTKNLPLFIFIKEDGCHWCELTKDLTMHDNEVIKILNTNYIPIKLDILTDTSIIKEFQVTHLPTMIILNSDHHVIDQFSGFMTPKSLLNKITPQSEEKINH